MWNNSCKTVCKPENQKSCKLNEIYVIYILTQFYRRKGQLVVVVGFKANCPLVGPVPVGRTVGDFVDGGALASRLTSKETVFNKQWIFSSL